MTQNLKKLIALDLDGTLLTREKTISPRTKAMLREAIALGHHVVIATGRPAHASMPYYDELELNTPMVNYNGALTHHAKDPNWGQHHFPLERNDALAILEACERIGAENMVAEIKDDYYMKSHDADFIRTICAGRAPLAVGEMSQLLTENPTALLIKPNDAVVHDLRAHLQQHHAHMIEQRLWGAPWHVIEIVRSGVTKATGLQVIAEHYGVRQEDVIAFGDEDNDLEMIQYAGHGVAMGNANQILKDVANHITATNDEDGIALMLEKLL